MRPSWGDLDWACHPPDISQIPSSGDYVTDGSEDGALNFETGAGGANTQNALILTKMVK